MPTWLLDYSVLINLDALYMIDNTLDSLDVTDWIWGFHFNLSSIYIIQFTNLTTLS